MKCINCATISTNVINSRPHKTRPSVWRRRSCKNCGGIFTTIEQPNLRYSSVGIGKDKTNFNYGKLVISIADAFQHDKQKGILHASDIADTVMGVLSGESVLDRNVISETTHLTIQRFDPLAATAYKLQHGL